MTLKLPKGMVTFGSTTRQLEGTVVVLASKSDPTQVMGGGFPFTVVPELAKGSVSPSSVVQQKSVALTFKFTTPTPLLACSVLALRVPGAVAGAKLQADAAGVAITGAASKGLTVDKARMTSSVFQGKQPRYSDFGDENVVLAQPIALPSWAFCGAPATKLKDCGVSRSIFLWVKLAAGDKDLALVRTSTRSADGPFNLEVNVNGCVGLSGTDTSDADGCTAVNDGKWPVGESMPPFQHAPITHMFVGEILTNVFVLTCACAFPFRSRRRHHVGVVYDHDASRLSTYANGKVDGFATVAFNTQGELAAAPVNVVGGFGDTKTSLSALNMFDYALSGNQVIALGKVVDPTKHGMTAIDQRPVGWGAAIRGIRYKQEATGANGSRHEGAVGRSIVVAGRGRSN